MTVFERPLGRRINPGLGALIVTGYLITGHPAVAEVSTPDWTVVAHVSLAAPVPSSLTLNRERDITPYPTDAHNQSTRSSGIDVLHAVLGTALAAWWLMGGAWVGIRSGRIPTLLDKSADLARNARRIRFM
jgi:hypothetical protein